jgi:hypothetical protein
LSYLDFDIVSDLEFMHSVPLLLCPFIPTVFTNYTVFPLSPYLKKQTQCQVGQNQPMFFYNKHLDMCGTISNSENKANSKPKQTQFPKEQKEIENPHARYASRFTRYEI